MATKSLFIGPFASLSDDAKIVQYEAEKMLGIIFDEWIKKGYNPREICYLITAQTQVIESECILRETFAEFANRRERAASPKENTNAQVW